jgi:protein TonB
VRRSFGGAIGVSAVTHAAIVVVILFISARMPDPTLLERAAVESPSIVWIGGGGGGGEQGPKPASRAEASGREAVTVGPPAQPTPAPQSAPEAPETPVQIDALPTATGITEMPGVIASVPSDSLSLGPGSEGGAGGGRGGGSGPGDGTGAGPGQQRGSGGGPFQPGTNGVTFPRLIREVAPAYTNAALQARVQGLVELRALVYADGSVGDVWVTRSLDRSFGIDDEAVRTVKQWRFAPATHDGKPVAVVVPIELRFTIR